MSDEQSKNTARKDTEKGDGGLFEKIFAGWTFRTNTPSYEPGQTLVAFVTAVESDGARVRVGDTVLKLTETTEDNHDGLLDQKVRVEVVTFDDSMNTGTAELLAVLDGSESSF
jgi:hypothetical protein